MKKDERIIQYIKVAIMFLGFIYFAFRVEKVIELLEK